MRQNGETIRKWSDIKGLAVVTIDDGKKVDAFELTGGLRDRLTGHYPTFSASHVTHYGRDVIVISDVAAQALQ